MELVVGFACILIAMDVEIKKGKRARALVKCKISAGLKSFQETLVQDTYLDWVEENENKIKSLRDEVQSIDSDIVEIYDIYEMEDSDENYIKETEEQIGFMINVDKQLNEMYLKFKSKNDSRS